MLTFERQWWRQAGAKETAIRDRFGVTPTRYYQVLNALVDRPDALAPTRCSSVASGGCDARAANAFVSRSWAMRVQRLDFLTVGRHAESGSDGRDQGHAPVAAGSSAYGRPRWPVAGASGGDERPSDRPEPERSADARRPALVAAAAPSAPRTACRCPPGSRSSRNAARPGRARRTARPHRGPRTTMAPFQAVPSPEPRRPRSRRRSPVADRRPGRLVPVDRVERIGSRRRPSRPHLGRRGRVRAGQHRRLRSGGPPVSAPRVPRQTTAGGLVRPRLRRLDQALAGR